MSLTVDEVVKGALKVLKKYPSDVLVHRNGLATEMVVGCFQNLGIECTVVDEKEFKTATGYYTIDLPNMEVSTQEQPNYKEQEKFWKYAPTPTQL
ncbi:MAG: hypothetical protein KKH52_01595 [Nanoarchaeota archaeon]|nr:hypothetical protein [Nanoarchaeota archaeon]MBU1623297.1 hypothetical protein [Nanoarchaeota archaeon]MBU1974067.1 hypothetical protein [Nanoarchaeota archaeon]